MYKKDILKDYINSSELRIYNEFIKVRLSSELAIKYDNGIYDKYLNNIYECLKKLYSLNIIFPGNSKPILYLYIVPDENYSKLLNIPTHFDRGTGGGRPVLCYDIDGFNSAYGLSQNILENYNNKFNISREENEIHELSHIIQSQFSSKNQSINEGLAETIPLYILDYEKEYEEHRNIIINLEKGKILSIQELINSEKDGTYGVGEAIKNKSCSFRYSYISSYLFIRGCIEKIKGKYSLDKYSALQKFLEILRNSKCMNEWLIWIKIYY